MNKALNRDLRTFLDKYRSFELTENIRNDRISLRGKLDIFDTAGEFWERFDIAIILNNLLYPHIIPQVYALSIHDYRVPNWHISTDGECCLDVPHRLIRQKKRGVNIVEFYKSKVYPFFANYCFKKATREYASGEYAHENFGIVQFYQEEFGLTDEKQIIKLLEVAMGKKKKVGRNDLCPICSSVKFKNCCESWVESLQLFGRERLLADYSIFDKLFT